MNGKSRIFFSDFDKKTTKIEDQDIQIIPGRYRPALVDHNDVVF